MIILLLSMMMIQAPSNYIAERNVLFLLLSDMAFLTPVSNCNNIFLYILFILFTLVE